MHTKLSSLLKLIRLSAESPPQQATLTLPGIFQVAFSFFTKNPGQTCLCGNLGSVFIHALNLPKLLKVSVFRIKEFHFSGQLSILSSVLLFNKCLASIHAFSHTRHSLHRPTVQETEGRSWGTLGKFSAAGATARLIPVATNRFSGRHYASREPHSVHQGMFACLYVAFPQGPHSRYLPYNS